MRFSAATAKHIHIGHMTASIKKTCLFGLAFLVLSFGISTVVKLIGSADMETISTYGPYIIKKKTSLREFPSYDFKNVQPFSTQTSAAFISAIDKEVLETAILSAIPTRLRVSAKKYIQDILFYSAQFQLDPLWVVSVIWTESHFRPAARSIVAATGLMQIMPRTGKFLTALLKRPSDKRLVHELLKDPKSNIELGTFYLRRLLKRFKTHRYATVAYNMGPTFVVRRLRSRRPVGNKNQYFDKVKNYYYLVQKQIKILESASRDHALTSFVMQAVPLDITHYFGDDFRAFIHPFYASR